MDYTDQEIIDVLHRDFPDIYNAICEYLDEENNHNQEEEDK